MRRTPLLFVLALAACPAGPSQPPTPTPAPLPAAAPAPAPQAAPEAPPETPPMPTPTAPPTAPAAAAPAPAPEAAPPLVAATRWSGAVTLPTGAKLALTVTFASAPDGARTATLDIPAQGLAAARLTDVVDDGTALAFSLPLPAGVARFTATQSDDHATATGLLEQGAGTFALHLRRLAPGDAPAAGPPRPQTPAPPYPYATRDATWENTADHASLAGTLSSPADGARHPAVLLITGSGPQDRDETILGHKPFLVLADTLTRRGFTVLRVDDRGFGASSVGEGPLTVRSNLRDVLASLAWLRAQPEVDPARVGLLGHSEGGLLVAMAAAERPDDVAFVVALAGPGVRGDALLVMQLEAILRASGASEADIAPQLELQRAVLELLVDGADDDAVTARVRQAVAEAAARGPVPGLPPEPSQREAYVSAQAAAVISPWFREFVALDPSAFWDQVRCPVLVVIGALDCQVPAQPNLEAIGAALDKAGNRAVTLLTLPRLNHLLQTALTGAPDEYGTIEETLAPTALTEIGAWLSTHAAAPAPPEAPAPPAPPAPPGR